MAKGREFENAPGPLNFRGCGLTVECLPARKMVRVRFPAAAPISIRHAISNPVPHAVRTIDFPQAGHQPCSRVSKTQLAGGRRFANFLLGPWQKSDAPALQAGINGSVTRRSPP